MAVTLLFLYSPIWKHLDLFRRCTHTDPLTNTHTHTHTPTHTDTHTHTHTHTQQHTHTPHTHTPHTNTPHTHTHHTHSSNSKCGMTNMAVSKTPSRSSPESAWAQGWRSVCFICVSHECVTGTVFISVS